MKIQNMKMRFLLLALTLCFSALAANAQTPNFTYQGRFTDATLPQPTNGTYNMQFALFDAASGGSQVGGTVTIPAVQVVNGIFTVSLDYGASPFAGAARFLEITVGNVTLTPRQAITSVPYALRARSATTATNSAQLGGIDANQYVTGQVVRSVNNIADNVTLAAGNNITITPSGNTLTIAATGGGGSGNYINNSTVQQANANFNISGGGTIGGTLSANLVNSATNYRIGGSTVLGVPNATTVVAGPLANYTLTAGNNAFFGYKAGAAANNTGQGNVFVGSEAGTTNSNGGGNSFVGRNAGFSNSSGNGNSFFGNSVGNANTIGNFNSFFGSGSGVSNTTGERNSFFGFQSGQSSKTVNDNAFFGYQAGKATTGEQNTFVGSKSGIANTTGENNTFVGYNSGGSVGSGNTLVGNSTDADGDNNTIIGNGSYSFAGGNNNTTLGASARVIPVNGTNFIPTNSTAIGAGAVADTSNTIVLGTDQEAVRIPGNLGVSGSSNISSLTVQSLTATGGPVKLTVPLGSSTGTNKPLCLNNNLVVLCPSSNFSNDKNSQVKIQPLQTQTSQEQLKIQAAQIEEQQKQLRQQQIMIENLRKLVCATNATADVCRQ